MTALDNNMILCPVLSMMSHYCATVSNICVFMELVRTGINLPVFTKEGYLFVESWFVTHSYVAMTYENLLCKRLLTRKSTAQTLHSEKNG